MTKLAMTKTHPPPRHRQNKCRHCEPLQTAWQSTQKAHREWIASTCLRKFRNDEITASPLKHRRQNIPPKQVPSLRAVANGVAIHSDTALREKAHRVVDCFIGNKLPFAMTKLAMTNIPPLKLQTQR